MWSMVLSRVPAEPAWEVVDCQDVSAVPTYIDESYVEILSVSSEFVSRTYTFNAPSSSSKKPIAPKSRRPPNPKCHSSTNVFSILKRKHTKPQRKFHFPSEDDASTTSSSGSSSRSNSEHEVDIHDKPHAQEKAHISVREALVFARQQLLTSSEVKKMGANVLVSEGWSVTRLRKGADQHRLQIRYFGRPARADLLSSDAALPSSLPPFLEMLEGSWY